MQNCWRWGSVGAQTPLTTPVAKTAKPKQDNPGSSSSMPLAEPHILQLTHWLSCCRKRTIIMSISAAKDKENYYHSCFTVMPDLKACCHSDVFSRRQISSCKLFVIELGKTMSMGTSLPSFVPSRNIFYFFSFSVAWLNRPPFRWRWNPRAADTGTPVKDTR